MERKRRKSKIIMTMWMTFFASADESLESWVGCEKGGKTFLLSSISEARFVKCY